MNDVWIKITWNKVAIVLLIALSLCHGVISELAFIAVVLILIIRNWGNLQGSLFTVLFIVVIGLYAGLMLVHLVFYDQVDSLSRLYGITKCYAGLSICMLFAARLCDDNIFDFLFSLLVVFNFVAAYAEINGIDKIGEIDLVLRNSAACMNLVFLPHLFLVKRRPINLFFVIYIISIAALLYAYFSRSFILGLCIFAFMALVYVFANYIKEGKVSIYRILAVLVLLTMIMIMVTTVFSDSLREIYLRALSSVDYARVSIIEYGINRRAGLSEMQQLFGEGEILYPVAYGRIIEAHNVVLEVLTMYGKVGVAVLVFDIAVFWSFFIGSDRPKSVVIPILSSLTLAYLVFFAHPFYSTNFIIKLFIVLTNMNTFLNYRELRTS